MNDLYLAVLEAVEGLVKLDPPADSPEGQLLSELAAACEKYEKKLFPL